MGITQLVDAQTAGDCAEWREVHCEGGECKRSFVKAES